MHKEFTKSAYIKIVPTVVPCLRAEDSVVTWSRRLRFSQQLDQSHSGCFALEKLTTLELLSPWCLVPRQSQSAVGSLEGSWRAAGTQSGMEAWERCFYIIEGTSSTAAGKAEQARGYAILKEVNNLPLAMFFKTKLQATIRWRSTHFEQGLLNQSISQDNLDNSSGEVP